MEVGRAGHASCCIGDFLYAITTTGIQSNHLASPTEVLHVVSFEDADVETISFETLVDASDKSDLCLENE